jgi:NAD(P)-dependent dehydrogenase (short-subunit alcohol dehydrogenase family)
MEVQLMNKMAAGKDSCDMDFSGRVALVTGAARGLGLAYARSLAASGAKVFLQDVGAGQDGLGEDPSIARAAAERLQGEGLDVLPMSAPILTREHCHGLVDDILRLAGRLDVIIHNAGWVGYEAVVDIGEASFDHMMAIAAKTPLWLSQAAWPSMLAAGYGRILLTTSDRAWFPEYAQAGLAAYAAAKMAAVGIVNVLALEGRPHGIVVNAISPVAKTRMWGVTGEPDELRPAEVAPGALFLVSDACKDGGWILRASNGQFHASRSCEADGVSYPRDLKAVVARSAQELAANWDRIAVPQQERRA